MYLDTQAHTRIETQDGINALADPHMDNENDCTSLSTPQIFYYYYYYYFNKTCNSLLKKRVTPSSSISEHTQYYVSTFLQGLSIQFPERLEQKVSGWVKQKKC